MDYVKSDLSNFGVKRWTIKALDRTEWAYVMREARDKLEVLKKMSRLLRFGHDRFLPNIF